MRPNPSTRPPSGQGRLTFDQHRCETFLGLLIDAVKGCAEIRVLGATISSRNNCVVSEDVYKKTVSVWGDDPAALAQEAARIRDVSAYVTLNPINPALKARADRLRPTKATSSDDDVVCLRFFPLDFDAERPDDISSTDVELAAAKARHDAFLADHPEMASSVISICSGNGYWALVLLPDYPNDDEHRALISRVADTLSAKYSDNLVKLDPKTKNPSRIIPLVGTMKCKGVDTQDRPHRMVTLESTPGVTITPFDLKAWAAIHAPELKPGSHQANGQAAYSPFATMAGGGSVGDVEKRAIAYLAKCGPAISHQRGHDKTFGVACRVGPGFDLTEDEAFRLIRDHYNPKCQPPWSDQEIRHKIADAYRKEMRRGWLLGAGRGKGERRPARTPRSRPDDPIVNRDGDWVPCQHNSKIWLKRQRPPLVIRYDRFRAAVLVDDEPVTDELVIDLTGRIEADLGVAWSQSHVLSAIVDLGHKDAFSSLATWLESLRWDGTPRVDGFFHRAYGCPRDPGAYLEECASVLFLSAVARALDPGCKADIMPVLISDQGFGKSMGISKLCPNPDWFADDLGCDLHDRRAGEGLHGKWLIEFAEFSRIHRSTIDVAKAFISRQSDYFRPAYGRVHKDFPRTCIFIGTTNDPHPFQDHENRRFLPIHCGKADLAWIEQNRDQLWAEAVHRYRGGESWWVTDAAAEKVCAEHREAARRDDAWETILDTALAVKSQITMQEAADVLGIEAGRLDRSMQTRLGLVLRRLGFTKKRDPVNARRYFYERP